MNTHVDFGKAFSFFTEDEKWLEKLGIGTGLILVSTILSVVLVGILGFFILAGYCLRLLQNVRDGVEKPLPEWDRWGDDLTAGLKLTVVMFLYALPALIFAIPIMIGSILTFAAADSSNEVQLVGLPFVLLGYCLVFLWGILYTLLQPGITIGFARDMTIGSALKFNAIWEWTRSRLVMVIIVGLVYWGVGSVLGLLGTLLGTLLCVVGLIITVPLSILLTSLIQYHMYGQLAREGTVDEAWQNQAEAPLPPYDELNPTNIPNLPQEVPTRTSNPT